MNKLFTALGLDKLIALIHSLFNGLVEKVNANKTEIDSLDMRVTAAEDTLADMPGKYVLPVASDTTLGGVKVNVNNGFTIVDEQLVNVIMPLITTVDKVVGAETSYNLPRNRDFIYVEARYDIDGNTSVEIGSLIVNRGSSDNPSYYIVASKSPTNLVSTSYNTYKVLFGVNPIKITNNKVVFDNSIMALVIKGSGSGTEVTFSNATMVYGRIFS